MARKARRASRRRPAGRRGANGWPWLAGGLVIGAVAGYLGYLLQAGPPGERPAQVEAAVQSAPVESPPAAPPPEPAATPAPEPPRFDFYTLLPEMEIEVETDAPLATREPARVAGEPTHYILQVGSFRRLDEADNLKARLALLGIEARIQTVVIRDDDIWYRVRVGPYETLRDLGQARARLQRNDIDFMVLRIGA